MHSPSPCGSATTFSLLWYIYIPVKKKKIAVPADDSSAPYFSTVSTPFTRLFLTLCFSEGNCPFRGPFRSPVSGVRHSISTYVSDGIISYFTPVHLGSKRLISGHIFLRSPFGSVLLHCLTYMFPFALFYGSRFLGFNAKKVTVRDEDYLLTECRKYGYLLRRRKRQGEDGRR